MLHSDWSHSTFTEVNFSVMHNNQIFRLMCVNCKLCLHYYRLCQTSTQIIERKIFPPYELSIHYMFYDQTSGEWLITIVLNDAAGRKKNLIHFSASRFFLSIKKKNLPSITYKPLYSKLAYRIFVRCIPHGIDFE